MTLHGMPIQTSDTFSVTPEVEIEIGYFQAQELIDFKWGTPQQLEAEIEKSKNGNIIVSRIDWEESSDNPDNYTS
jgi:hypothetical protein